MNTGSPPRSWTRTGEPGSIVVPMMSVASASVSVASAPVSGTDAATISMPPAGVGWSTTPAAASASSRARSATVVRAFAAVSPVSSDVVTAAAPSIQRSRSRTVSYSRALPTAIPACAARTRSSARSSSVKEPSRFSVR